MNISLAAEPIFSFLGLRVTNSLLGTWTVMAVLIIIAFIISKSGSIVPKGLQNIFEEIFQMFLELCQQVAPERARTFFPLVFTFFIFILFSNWFGLLPGIGSIGFNEEIHGKTTFIPLFRAATSDLNTTIALALIAMGSVQLYGFKFLKLAYLKRFFNFKSPILLFVGLLELLSDISKIISFAFRLFGNIFAGEVLLMVMAFLLPMVGSLPFFGLELFVGFIQALVFAMLSLVFANVATIEEQENE